MHYYKVPSLTSYCGITWCNANLFLGNDRLIIKNLLDNYTYHYKITR